MRKPKINFDSHDRVINNLTAFSNARIAIGHSGGHLRTASWLKFQLDFAAAKDALTKPNDLRGLAKAIAELPGQAKTFITSSPLTSLDQFLTRPDLGRTLSNQSVIELNELIATHPEYLNCDILILLSGGLSATAIERQAVPLLSELLPLVRQLNWSIAPIFLSEYTRVAFADKVNAILQAKMLVNLIGERPGLSSSDSMSIYFTYASRLDTSDEQRNCISNIHGHGLTHKEAAEKLVYLIAKSFSVGFSGVNLKDDFSNARYKQLLLRSPLSGTAKMSTE